MLPNRQTDSSTARVLVIDDDLALVAILRDLLELEGYEVVTHGRAEDVQDLVQRVCPSAILLDLRLGGREAGWDVLDGLALDPATRSIPVILCSGAVDSLAARAAVLRPEYGVRVLPKPFDADVLLALLEEICATPVAVGAGSVEARRPTPVRVASQARIWQGHLAAPSLN
jgi:CheY-like chemotaxis protein